jgi:hypothetical protein
MVNLFERLNRPPSIGGQPKLGTSELAQDLQKLHDWLQHWDQPTVCLRDICYRGPNSIRNRKRAIGLAEILVGHGWLIPNRAHRYDRHLWQIVRGRDGYPTVASAPPAPLRSV